MVRTGGLGLWALVGLLAQTPALAQGAPASDDAQAAERMDRARRAADSPMKRIQEAARLAPPPPPARPPSVTVQLPARKPAPPASPAATPAPAPTAPAPLTPEPAATSAPAPEPAPASPPAPAVAAEPVSMPAAPPPSAPPPAPPPAPDAPPATPAAPVTPVLVSMVEPQFPLTFDPGPGSTELRFVVRFAIRADGRVSDVRVQSGPTDRAARNAVRQAVERWRYAPVPQDLAHEVELILKLQG